MLIIFALALTAAQGPALSSEDMKELEYSNALAAKWGEKQRTVEEFAAQKASQNRMESDYEAQRLRSAGFEPATDVQRQGRSVIRVTFTEPRLFLRMPGVTLERNAEGQTRITLSSDGRAASGTAVLSESAVAELNMLEKEAFVADPPQPFVTWRKGDPLPERPSADGVCHAWGTVLERITPTNVDKVWGHGCYSQRPKQRLDYSAKVASIAVAAFPQCTDVEPYSDPFWRLGKCLGKFEPSTSDNP